MNVKELHSTLSRLIGCRYEENEVMIAIKLPYSTVGAIPMVKVKNVHNGFDWENGKLIIYPEENLTPSDRDFAKQMTEMQERTAEYSRENRHLKAEIKRLKKLLETKDESKN